MKLYMEIPVRSQIGNDFPISVFARVRGIAYYNQMSGDLHRAEAYFRRKVIFLKSQLGTTWDD